MQESSKPSLNNIISYVNVDSSKRKKEMSNIYEKELYSLPPYPIQFTNGSSIITVQFPQHPLETGDRVVLSNVISKNVILQNVLEVKKDSFFVKINHRDHGLSLYGLYNPDDPKEFTRIDYAGDLPEFYQETEIIPDQKEYYVLNKNAQLDFTLQLSNIKGSDVSRSLIGNIPINYLNRRQIVYLRYSKNNGLFVADPDNYLIKLRRRSAINYRDGTNHLLDHRGLPTPQISSNTIHIKYYNLFGVPLNYLNSGTPTNGNMKYPSQTVVNTDLNTFSLDINYSAVVDPQRSFYYQSELTSMDLDSSTLINANRGGGYQIFLRKVKETMEGFPHPNFYAYPLDRIYKNITQARIIASAFPNSQRIINDTGLDRVNNKLYWRNLDDGDYIYSLAITPGNYTTQQLSRSLEKAFSQTLRYQYSQEYQEGIFPSVIHQSTPLNHHLYDAEGHYKYHSVEVSISDTTDIVTFSAYRKILLSDNLSILDGRVLTVPDVQIEIIMAESLQIDLGINGTHLFPFIFSPFRPVEEVLYIYFTPNTHIRLETTFSYLYGNLYRYETSRTPYALTAVMETARAVLLSFWRTMSVYPQHISLQEIRSINTNTLLRDFIYEDITGIVSLPNHLLSVGDLIITDQFYHPISSNQIFVYEIVEILDFHRFRVVRYGLGTRYKFIYDGLIINFSTDPEGTIFWLDQIAPSEPILSLAPPLIQNYNTLSLTELVIIPGPKQILSVLHPQHQLKVNDQITLFHSASINQVPADVINQTHTIHRILGENRYEIVLGSYTPLVAPLVLEQVNMVLIKYPDIFQLLFNYPDTLGSLLSFAQVGQEQAITPYRHQIRNTDPYENDYGNNSSENRGSRRLKKLNMTGDNYFYISSPELSSANTPYHNTRPVSNVFAIGRWFDEPGTVVFDSVIPSPRLFDPPLLSLSEIHITISHPDGRLVDFNELDHQFVIEIVESRSQCR